MSTAPTDGPEGPLREVGDDDEMPRISLSRSQLIVGAIFIASAVAFFYFVLPKITGLQDTWHRLDQGDPLWLVAAGVLELLSFVGYVMLFRTVCLIGEQDHLRIGWRVSYQITMAGLAATRLFAAAGAGGIALTAWALRRSGMSPRTVAVRMVAMTALLYAVFMLTVFTVGILLYTGIVHGGSEFVLTLMPAMFALAVVLVVGSMALLPADAERRFDRWAKGTGRMRRIGQMLVTVPAAASTGVRAAIATVRERPLALVGAIAWWAFDIGTLWACFHAFAAETPPIAVIIMSYFLGMTGNLLPLPGGVGGVEGGMIAAFAAFDVNFGLATVAVLSYRAFSFWLPTIPGAIAYVQLRGTVKRWRAEAGEGSGEDGREAAAPAAA